MRKSVGMFTAVMLAMGVLLAGCGSKGNESTSAGNSKDSSKGTSTSAESTAGSSKTGTGELLNGKHNIEIEIQNYGTIKVELDADKAPITTTNFVKLAKEGFYDGLTFHRIIDGFMIQGGDPDGNGTGGSDENIKGEFSKNGVENDISHVRGTISMARSQDMDSASSQFFIVQSDYPSLDGEYAGFGTVTEGMEIVDKICKDVQVEDNNGTVASENQPVITSIKVVD